MVSYFNRNMYRLHMSESKIVLEVSVIRNNDMKGQFTMLHNKELHDLYGIPNIVTTVKCRIM
jgi:hypothetical protein